MKTLLLLLSLSLSVVAFGQKKNEFRLGIGYQQTWLVDQQASPLLYSAHQKKADFRYTRFFRNGLLLGELEGAVGDFFPVAFKGRQFYETGYNEDGSPKTGSWPLVGTLYSGQVKIGYLHRVQGNPNNNSRNIQFSGFAGAYLTNQLFYSDNIIRAGWLNSSSLDLAYLASVRLHQKHLFNAGLSASVLARNTRLPYHNSVGSATDGNNIETVFRQGSKITSLDKFQSIRIEAGYLYDVSKKFGLGIQYAGQWLHYSQALPVTCLQHQLVLSVTLKS